MTTTNAPFIIVPDGYSRKKNPDTVALRPLGLREVQSLEVGKEVWVLDRHGRARTVRVTGRVKLWKTRPDDADVPLKYGMYEHFRCEVRGGEYQNGTLYAIAFCIDCGICPDSDNNGKDWSTEDDIVCGPCAAKRRVVSLLYGRG